MPEYEDISLEEALAHLRDGTGKVEGRWGTDWHPLRKGLDESLVYRLHDGEWRTLTYIFAWSFRLVKEPEIVKPVAMKITQYSGEVRLTYPGVDMVWIGRPRTQQERLDALVEAFLVYTTGVGYDGHHSVKGLRDFLRAEKEAK